MFRDLLIHVDGSDAARARLAFAEKLATRLSARLSGLHVSLPLKCRPTTSQVIPEVESAVSERLHLQASRAATLFNEIPEPRGRWIEYAGDTAAGICHAARYADLVIVGQSEWQGCPNHIRYPLRTPSSSDVADQSSSCRRALNAASWTGSRSHGMGAARQSGPSTMHFLSFACPDQLSSSTLPALSPPQTKRM